MENSEVEKLSKNLLSPSWMFWINKEQTIQNLILVGNDGYPALKNIVKFIDITPLNNVVVLAFQAFAMIISPFHKLIYGEFDDITYEELHNLYLKAIEQNENSKITKIPPEEIRTEYDKLASLLNKKNDIIIEFTLRTLGVIGAYSYPYLSEIERFIEHDNILIKLSAKFAYANITGNDSRFINFAFNILNSNKSDDVKNATAILLQFTVNCQLEKYIPEIKNTYYNNRANKVVQCAIIESIKFHLHDKQLDPENVRLIFNLLFEALSDSDLDSFAKMALLYIGPLTVPYFIDVFENYLLYNNDSIISAVKIIGRIGKAATPAKESISKLNGKFDETADNYIRWSLKDIEKYQ